MSIQNLISLRDDGTCYVIFPNETKVDFREEQIERYILPTGAVFLFKDNYLSLENEM